MDLLLSRRGLWAKFFAYGLGSLVLLSLPIKFWYLFSGQTLSGWDTPGHIVLAKEFAKLVQTGSATGWSDVWFGGFPIFYFYPPFYYFFVYSLHLLLSINIESAFSISVFITILLLVTAIYSFAKQFLWSIYPKYIRVILGLSSVLFYFNYAGEGLQGTSLVGIVEGTVVSSFTHSLILFALVSLDKYRKKIYFPYLILFVGLTSIIFYSHLLSSVFYSLMLLIYCFEYRHFFFQNIKVFSYSLVTVFFLISPVVYNYFCFSEYTSGVFYGYSYPPLLSILGKDVYDSALRAYSNGENLTLVYIVELFSSGRWLSLAAIALLIFHFRKFHSSPRSKFISTILLVFFWLSLDYSLGYIFPNLKIHNYRAFDCFFISFSILFSLSIRTIAGNGKNRLPFFSTIFVVLMIEFYIFINFNPTKYQEYQSPIWQSSRSSEELTLYQKLADRLSSLPNGTLVQPEIIRSKSMFGTPHFWLPLLYEAGVRNNLGLTVESSYYSTLVFNWQEFGFANNFRWGTDVDWRENLISLAKRNPDSGYYLDFLLRSDVTHLVGYSPQFHEYIGLHKQRLEIIGSEYPFFITKILPNPNLKSIKPIGLIHTELLNSQSEYRYRDFLKISNLLQMYLVNLGYHTKVLKITKKQLDQFETIVPSFSAFILISKEGGIGDESWNQNLKSKKIPSAIIRESQLLLDNQSFPIQTLSELLESTIEIPKSALSQSMPQSYFGERKSDLGELLLDDTGKEYLFVTEENGKYSDGMFARLPSLKGKIYLWGMIISFVFLLSGMFLTKIPYFSFSKTK